MKRCIVYLPYEMPERGSGPLSLRPQKMVQAFRDIGYEVFAIWGRCAERKRLIKELKSSITDGCRYELMYTESSTEPTFLNEPHRYPTHPFMDFSFFKYVKNQGIPIALFYRDIFWKFNNYGLTIRWWKRLAAKKCFLYDIRQYEKLLDRIYFPCFTMADLIGSQKLKKIAAILLPGAENLSLQQKNYADRDFSQNPLHIFYAGSIHEHYHLTELLKAVGRTAHCVMTLCCREQLWLRERDKIEPFISENIQVIHKYNDELEPYYNEADIGSLFYENNSYMDMAVPFKTFEYLAHEIPAIATANTAIGNFIGLNGVGWVLPYNADALCQLLNQIIERPELLDEKRRNCIKVKQENLWIHRAKTVENDLVGKYIE